MNFVIGFPWIKSDFAVWRLANSRKLITKYHSIRWGAPEIRLRPHGLVGTPTPQESSTSEFLGRDFLRRRSFVIILWGIQGV